MFYFSNNFCWRSQKILDFVQQFLIQKLQYMSTSSDYIEDIKSVYTFLQNSISSGHEKIQSQSKIYLDLYRIFSKNATKLATVANNINQEVLASSNHEEMTNQYYQMLSNSLLRLADCSRRVALRFRSEVLDPLKTFNENYENIYEDIQKKIDTRIQQVVSLDQEHLKLKQNYIQAYEKFEKHRQMQKKVMEKIQNGNKNELEKFNNSTKKLTENISSSEKFYLSAVQKLNNEWLTLRKEFLLHSQSLSYNQNTKQTFFRKTIVNSIKTLQQYALSYDPDVVKKMQQSIKQSKNKNEQANSKRLSYLLEKVINCDYREQFVSYEDTLKNKKKKIIEEESHLSDFFSKLKNKEKNLISNLILPWFTKSNRKNTDSSDDKGDKQKSLTKVKSLAVVPAHHQDRHNISHEKTSERQLIEIDQCRQKIISEISHSFYFVELLYQQIAQMSSFYCKLNEENFFYVLNAFTVITKNIDDSNEIGIEFIYKMMIASQRIMLNKAQSNRQGQNQQLQLLCQKYGRNTLRFRDSKLLSKLLAYIQKRKATKKRSQPEGKGTLNNIAKGIFAAFSRKNPSLNEEQLYNCLQELIKIIANFSVPNEIALPFIKQVIGSSHQSSYQYLKGIILNKKDVEERQSLFYQKQIKEKKEQLLKKAVESKKMGQIVLKITAQHGFFGVEELSYRVVCKQLKDIHLQILARLKMSTEKKWIRLIPVDKNLDYIMMKQEVAEESVPSPVQQIITLDVNRSLHLHGESLNPTILHSLLRTYAHFHKDISYCQGMNYLAGYIYIKTINQESTYRIFQYLMGIRFKEIFINQFQVLKLKMYQFERLLAIFHPQISEHFKRQSISPQCYIVSWIITLFASSYQYTLSSFLIDFLWQRFIIWGWPEFFRFVLWVFSLFKVDLVELTYDRALHFLGELGRSQMFLADETKFRQKFASIEDPKVGIQRYPVSQELLNKFTQQYQLDK